MASKSSPTLCFPGAVDAMRYRIAHELGWKARVPEHPEAVCIERPQ